MRLFRQLFTAGAIAFFILGAFALLFYKERMVLPDDANYIFELVTNGGHFAIFHDRFIAVLTQPLPWLAIRWSWQLDTVARLYSLNLVLFYAGCYLLCGLVFRSYKAALALLLAYLLFTSHTFYWTVSELGQGIALLFVAFAMLSVEWQDGRRSNILRALFLAAIVITVVFAHGLTFFAGSFLLLYLWLDQSRRWRWLLATVCLYIAVMIFKRLFMYDEYDKSALGGIMNFIRLFPNYFSTESMHYFAARFLGPYCWIPIIFLLNAIYYIRSKTWLKLGLMTSYCFGYLMLTTVAFPKIEGNGFYNENLLLPMAVFLCVPLVYDVIPLLGSPVLAGSLVALIIVTGLFRIWYFHPPYSARLAWQRGIMEQYDGREVVLNAANYPKDTWLIAWSAPYEFWLLSTMEQHKTASIIISDKPQQATDAMAAGPKKFATSYGAFDYGQLSRFYFNFTDTVNSYEFIP